MYSIKRGVSIFMSDEIEKILSVICPVFNAFKIPVVITSGLDGPHRSESLHYKFRAIDIRKNFSNNELTETFAMHRDLILSAIESRSKIAGYPIVFIVEEDHHHIEWRDHAENHNT